MISYGHYALGLGCQNDTVACQDGALVQGNYVNVDFLGRPLAPVAGRFGIEISAAQPSLQTVGGLGAGAANTIAMAAFNAMEADGPGAPPNGAVSWAGNRFVGIPQSGRVPVRFSPYTNLGGEPTPNDPGDADDGANRWQNSPEFVSVSWTEGPNPTTTIQYRVDTAVANADYPLRVDLQRVVPDSANTVATADVVRSETYPAASAQQLVTVVYPVIASSMLPFMAMATDASGRSSEYTALVGDVLLVNGFEDTP